MICLITTISRLVWGDGGRGVCVCVWRGGGAGRELAQVSPKPLRKINLLIFFLSIYFPYRHTDRQVYKLIFSVDKLW